MSTTDYEHKENGTMSNAIATIEAPFMSTGLPLFSGYEYKVADMSDEAIRFGRKEIELAEHEMPGLMALREEFAGQKPIRENCPP